MCVQNKKHCKIVICWSFYKMLKITYCCHKQPASTCSCYYKTDDFSMLRKMGSYCECLTTEWLESSEISVGLSIFQGSLIFWFLFLEIGFYFIISVHLNFVFCTCDVWLYHWLLWKFSVVCLSLHCGALNLWIFYTKNVE